MMELYYFTPSAPCRAVMLFVEALNLKPKMKEVDLMRGDNLTSDFLKLNPQHTIPLIVDNGFVLSESRAILVYLAEQYGQNYSCYPNDPKARGVINQRLMFDIGTLYPRFLDVYSHFFLSTHLGGLDMNKVAKLKEAFDFLESFMGESSWMAGDAITIADYSLVATVSSIEACGFNLSDYEKVVAWLERCKEEIKDYDEINQKGADMLGSMVRQNLKKSVR